LSVCCQTAHLALDTFTLEKELSLNNGMKAWGLDGQDMKGEKNPHPLTLAGSHILSVWPVIHHFLN
jgi:hypothetical protein